MDDDIRRAPTPLSREKGSSDLTVPSGTGAAPTENTRKSVNTNDILKPITRPERHPPIDARPVVLMHATTIVLGLTFLLIGLIIVTLFYRAGTDYRFRVTDHYMYFTAQYVPSIIGTLSVIAFRSLLNEFHRMNPYFAMADRTNELRGGAPPSLSTGLRYFPQFFRSWSRGFTLFADITTFIVIAFVVPAKASLLSTQQQADGTWAIVLHRLSALFLICAYGLMTVFVLAITIHLWDRQTGLKWYPAAMADQLALFRNEKTLSYFALLENLKSDDRSINDGNPKCEPPTVKLRLGYWAPTSPGSAEVWYGVGLISDDTEGQHLSTTSDEAGGITAGNPPEELCNCGLKKCEDYPYKFGVLWQGDGWFIGWSVLIAGSFGLCLYTLATGLLHTGILVAHHTSYSLLLYSFLFRFLPTALAGMLTGYFRRIDVRKCFTQSFASMYGTNSGSASDTILLEYLTGLPLLVPLTACRNGHYKVAWFSLVNTVSPFFPIVVGGIFTMVDTGTHVQLNIGMPSFTTSFLFLTLYGGSMFFARPTDNRLLPLSFFTLTDLIVMCHASNFLRREDFDISHPATTREHMVARVFLREDKYRLGVYRGVDGKRHLGFDKVDLVAPLDKDSECKHRTSKAG